MTKKLGDTCEGAHKLQVNIALQGRLSCRDPLGVWSLLKMDVSHFWILLSLATKKFVTRQVAIAEVKFQLQEVESLSWCSDTFQTRSADRKKAASPASVAFLWCQLTTYCGPTAAGIQSSVEVQLREAAVVKSMKPRDCRMLPDLEACEASFP